MSREKILVADGNERDRHALANFLLSEGYDVLVAEDGAEAVNAVRSGRPDLVLLNTSFPPDVAHGGGAFDTGFLVIDWLTRLKEVEATRFILITGEDASKFHDRARASGAKGLFQKPINPEALLGAIRQILPQQESVPQ